MPFKHHAPPARQLTVTFALGALLLAAAMPAVTSPFVEFSANGVPACAERVQTRLFFGLHGPMGTVSESEWETFLAEVVTPRFPDGLTVFRAQGQWRGPGGRLEHEPSRVVEIVHDDLADAKDRIHKIVKSYKTRYQQESVLVTRTRAEVCW